jgi:hypothetical protein
MCTDKAAPTVEVALAVLDHKPLTTSELSPGSKDAAPGPESKDGQTGVSLQDHPEYGKYFKMMKAGVPIVDVKEKMRQSGLDPNMLERDPMDIVPSSLDNKSPPSDGAKVPLQDHPVYSKYFRMLKVGLPPPTVRAKMEQDGLDPAILEKSPTDLHPIDDKKGPGEMVPLGEHPAYGKYLRMLKVGLPLAAAKQKMVDDGFDPTILDKGANDLVPLDTTYREKPEAPKAAFKLPPRTPAAKIRKKKLHWKALDSSRVGKESLWAANDEDDEGFQLDADEFNKLFVQR